MLKRIVIGAVVAGVSWSAYSAVRRWWNTWGAVPDEAARALPGDDVIEAAQAIDTRGITIEAPPELVWPWLIQMGFGRGGWYSIDALDMRGSSADRIVDAWQHIEVGDVLPTHPGGGFQVRALEPGRSMVLYADPRSMQPEPDATESVPAGLAASGAFLSQTPSDFAATWTFVLEPLGTGRTRLIERVRYWGAEGSPMTKAALSLLGFGVFVMMQRQMVGIRERAERLAIEEHRARNAVAARPTGNGHAPDVAETVLVSADPG